MGLYSCMMATASSSTNTPDWDALYATAEVQAGHFTVSQAEACGYSPQLLQKHLARERIQRVRRGIYRLAHFPRTENEELVALWLWSDQQGVFSHETSLALHDLSDVLPRAVHMTVPEAWRKRRLRVPDGLVLHYGDLDKRSRTWLEAVPLTAPSQVLAECIDVHVAPELIEQALRQARRRGLISSKEATRLSKRRKDASENPL
jgi:predicted transcriptional regulator of viral defense system